MSTFPRDKLMTAEELLKLPDDGYRYELVKGELRQMAPAGEEHGLEGMKLSWRLAQFVETHKLGVVYMAETGFKLEENPDTVRAPDIAFVSREKLEAQPPGRGYRKGAPDLAVEVVSPGDRPAEVAEKVHEWLYYGAREVWVLDSERQTVTVYRPGEALRVLHKGDALRAELFPGWSLPLSELFDGE